MFRCKKAARFVCGGSNKPTVDMALVAIPAKGGIRRVGCVPLLERIL